MKHTTRKKPFSGSDVGLRQRGNKVLEVERKKYDVILVLSPYVSTIQVDEKIASSYI